MARKVLTTKANQKPNYIKIFQDIIDQKFPEKKSICTEFLDKSELTSLEVLKLNQLIFDQSLDSTSKNHVSYSKDVIIEMLNYQKDKKISNIELAKHFGVSRNSITKWKKLFSDDLK